MSGYTMTQGELLYSCGQACTPVTTPVVTPGMNMIPGLPPIQVPAGYMKNGTGTMASSLRLAVWGLLQATATVPTFGFGLNYTTANTWSATTPLVTISAAQTMTAGTATYPFYAFWDIIYRTPNASNVSANGVVVSMGQVECPGIATTGTCYMPPAGTLGNATAWDPNLSYYLWPSYFCGAATASNFLTTEIVKLYGEN